VASERFLIGFGEDFERFLRRFQEDVGRFLGSVWKASQKLLNMGF
jgi:hypothetical protein